MRTVTNVLHFATREIANSEKELHHRPALIKSIRTAAARLKQDGAALEQIATRLAAADGLYRRMKAGDEAAAVIDSVLTDLV